MKIDELINELEQVKEKHGNQEINLQVECYAPYLDNLENIKIKESSYNDGLVIFL